MHWLTSYLHIGAGYMLLLGLSEEHTAKEYGIAKWQYLLIFAIVLVLTCLFWPFDAVRRILWRTRKERK